MRDQRSPEAETLQDMVTGGLGIDAILDVPDATGEGETARLLKDTPDILHLIFPGMRHRNSAHNTVLP